MEKTRVRFKPKNESLKGFQECDICERTDQKDILTLFPERFSKERGTQKERKAKRVCFQCAQNLFSDKIYNFGNIWREIFFHNLGQLESKKSKYMVIHK